VKKFRVRNPFTTTRSPLRALVNVSVSHHNKIQFFGYEVANVMLVANEYMINQTTYFGVTTEMAAALFLLLGSAAIWRFDFHRRPAMLFFGGIGLAIGGLLLAVAGYILTGLAVLLASLETARGGLVILTQHVSQSVQAGSHVSLSVRKCLKLASLTLGWYAWLINHAVSRFRSFGAFVNDRPFLTSTLIKAPLRLEFIIKKLLQGDFVGAMVGLSWMLLGDFGLALNDDRLRASLQVFADARRR